MYRQRLRFYADGGQEIPPELQEYVQEVSPFTEADTVGVYPGQDPYAGMSDEDKRMIINQQLYDIGVGGKNYLNPVHVGQTPGVILPEVDYPVGQIPAPEGYVQTEGQVPQQVVVDGVDVTNGIPTEGEMPQAEGVVETEGEVENPQAQKVQTPAESTYQTVVQPQQVKAKSGVVEQYKKVKKQAEKILNEGKTNVPKKQQEQVKKQAEQIAKKTTGIGNEDVGKIKKLDGLGVFHYNSRGELYMDTNKANELVVDGRLPRDLYNWSYAHAKKKRAKYMSPEDRVFSEEAGAENLIEGLRRGDYGRALTGVGEIGLNALGAFGGSALVSALKRAPGYTAKYIPKVVKAIPGPVTKMISGNTPKLLPGPTTKMLPGGAQKLLTGTGAVQKALPMPKNMAPVVIKTTKPVTKNTVKTVTKSTAKKATKNTAKTIAKNTPKKSSKNLTFFDLFGL